MSNLLDGKGHPVGTFFEQAAFGSYPGIRRESLSGMAFAVGDGEWKTIWGGDGFYVPPSSETAVNSLAVASTHSSDIDGGTGINKLIIIGLDTNYTYVTETVSLNGLTPVKLTKEFFRINDSQAYTVGNSCVAQGMINIGTGVFSSNGVAATKYDVIPKLFNKSTTAQYTVAASHSLLIYQPVVAIDLFASEAIIRPVVKQFYDKAPFIQVSAFKAVNASPGTPRLTSLLSEKSELQVWVNSTASNPDVAVAGGAYLIENSFFDDINKR